MSVSRPHDFTHAAQKSAERRVARQVRAQRQLIYEEPYQAFGLDAVAVGDIGSDDEVFAPREVVQKHLEGGHQRDKKRRAFTPAERFERLGQLPAESRLMPRAFEGLNLWTRPVR